MRKFSVLSALALAVGAFACGGCAPKEVPAVNPAPVAVVNPPAADPAVQPNANADAPPPSALSLVKLEGEVSLVTNLYFVVDGSGSMGDRPPAGGQFRSKMDAAKWAVKEVLKSVPENTNLGLYVFDRRGAREVLALGPNNRKQFLTAIDAIRDGDGTPLGDAIHKGTDALVKQYSKQLGYGDYRLMVITDGDSSDDINYGVSHAVKYTMPIYTIGFGIGEGHALRKFSVLYKNADSAAELKAALGKAVSELEVFDDPDGFDKK